LAAAFLLVAVAIFLLSREHLRAATLLSLAAWLVLGFFVASITQQPKSENYVLKVLNSGELDFTRCFTGTAYTVTNPQRYCGEPRTKSNWPALLISSGPFPSRAACAQATRRTTISWQRQNYTREIKSPS
jgi:hypothetical protein